MSKPKNTQGKKSQNKIPLKASNVHMLKAFVGAK